MGNFLRLLPIVIVDMLFNGVAFSKHIENLALVDPPFDFVCIAFLFHVHDLFAFHIQYMLASFKSCF